MARTEAAYAYLAARSRWKNRRPSARGEQTHRRSRENSPDIHHVGLREPARTIARRHDDICREPEKPTADGTTKTKSAAARNIRDARAANLRHFSLRCQCHPTFVEARRRQYGNIPKRSLIRTGRALRVGKRRDRRRGERVAEPDPRTRLHLDHSLAHERRAKIAYDGLHVLCVIAQRKTQCARAAAKTAGSSTATWSTAPATEPHARMIASRSWGSRPPQTHIVAIIAAFQITGRYRKGKSDGGY